MLAVGADIISPFGARPKVVNESARFVSKLKGFNFSYFYKFGQEKNFVLDDFIFVADNGFRVARIPFDYRVLFRSLDVLVPNCDGFVNLDKLISGALSLDIHVVLCMHRAPGYCVNPPYETRSLWRDKDAAKEFLLAWGYIANRYAGVGSGALSFNLINEPKREVSESVYLRVMLPVFDVIRNISRDRVIVLDGLAWGTQEIKSAYSLEGLIQGARGYFPMQFTHHKAEWVNEKYQGFDPRWPLPLDGDLVGYSHIERGFERSWARSICRNIPVTVGEWGVYNKTPHAATLSYMTDCLNIFNNLGWGWLLWNFRGPFGVVNSNRDDVVYADWGVYKVDVKMLNILRAFL